VRAGRIKATAIEPREARQVTKITVAPTGKRMGKLQGQRANIPPIDDAVPAPPLKPRKRE
jgi:hypothetical protein